MFAPSQEQVRRFFCEAWFKHKSSMPLTPLEAQAVDWMVLHFEYHDDLSDVDAVIARQYSVPPVTTPGIEEGSSFSAVIVPNSFLSVET